MSNEEAQKELLTTSKRLSPDEIVRLKRAFEKQSKQEADNEIHNLPSQLTEEEIVHDASDYHQDDSYEGRVTARLIITSTIISVIALLLITEFIIPTFNHLLP